MRYSNRILEVIKPAKTKFLIGLVGLLLAVSSIAVLVTGSDKRDNAKKKPFTIFTQPDKYCYFDVVYITDWLVRDDTLSYYVAVNKSGECVIVAMNNSIHGKFTSEYLYKKDNKRPAPAPIRITGMSCLIKPNVENMLVKSLSYDDVNSLHYDYGSVVLNAQMQPDGIIEAIAIFLTVISIPVSLIFFVLYLREKHKYNNTRRYYQNDAQFEGAAFALESSSLQEIKNERYIAQDDFIIFPKTGIAVNYNDILWIYKSTTYYNGLENHSSLKMITKLHGRVEILRVYNILKYAGLIDSVLELIYNNNHDVVVGFSKESQKQFRQNKKSMKIR